MKSFQMNLPGYDSSSDQTEDLVKWVNAPNKRAADIFAKSIGAENVEQIRNIEEEEVDHVLDGRGWVIRSPSQHIKQEKRHYCDRCGLPMSYQEFEDEDGENFQWRCDGPNYGTKRKGCGSFNDLDGPLEFQETSNEQLVDTLINEVESLERKGQPIGIPFEHPDPSYIGSRGYEIDKWKFEILRRMK